MSRIVPLLGGDATDVERWLLDSARDDAPGPSAREAAVLALAAGVTAATSSAAAGLPGAAAMGTAGAASGAKATGSVLSVAVLKWLAVGAAAGAVVSTVATVATRPPPASPTRAVVSPPPRGPAAALIERAARAAVPALRADEATTLHPAPDIPSMTSTARASAPPGAITIVPPAPAPEAPAESDSVVDEVASLDRARAALAARDPITAIELLSAHEARFGGGALEPEAVVLRVRALLDLGRRDRAKALAEAFLRKHPGTAQAAHLRALIGSH